MSPGSNVSGCHDDTFLASGAVLGGQEHHAAHSRPPCDPNAGDFSNVDTMLQQQTMQLPSPPSLENPLLQPAPAPREGAHLDLQACPEVEEDTGDEEEGDDDEEEEEEEEKEVDDEEEDDDDEDEDEEDKYDVVVEEPPPRPGRRKMPYQFIKTHPRTEAEEDVFWGKWDAMQKRVKQKLLEERRAKRRAERRKAAKREAAQREAAQWKGVVVC